jgi:hypothetical protein
MRAASLRKADILAAGAHEENRSRSLESNVQLISHIHGAEHEKLIPTEPVTPTHLSTPVKKSEHFPSIPIVSPTVQHVDTFRLPLTSETVAKIRIGKYKEREGTTVEQDHIRFNNTENTTDVDAISEHESLALDDGLSSIPRDWESFHGLEKNTRESVLDWFIQVLFSFIIMTMLNSRCI